VQPEESHIAGRIVVGVDGSDNSMRALEWAAREARLRDVTLEVVHAEFARPELLEIYHDLTKGERDLLARAVTRAQELEPSISVRGLLAEPPAGKALVAASEGADLLVVASRGLTGLRELVLGSVSNECAHHALCPVVIVRPQPVAPGQSGV
jgi:nucleotide-binding universal stress UspA family protein